MKIKSLVIAAVLAIAVLGVGFGVKAQTTDQSALIAQLQAEIQALMQQIQALIAQQGSHAPQIPTTSTSSAWCHTFNDYLKLGDSNSSTDGDIANLVIALGDSNILLNEGTRFTFNADMRQGVIQFQKKYGILQIGTVGPITRAKLNSLYGCSANSNPTPAGQGQQSITVSVPSNTSNILVLGGQNQIGAVTVTAGTQAAVKINTVTFNITNSGFNGGLTLSNPSLNAGSVQAYGTTCTADKAVGTTIITCTLGSSYATDYMISAGQSQVFSLFATVSGQANAGSTASISSSLLPGGFLWDNTSTNGQSGTGLSGSAITGFPTNSYVINTNAPTAQPSITVTSSPTGSLLVGSTVNIAWTSQGISSSVGIGFCPAGQPVTGNQCTESQLVPNTGSASISLTGGTNLFVGQWYPVIAGYTGSYGTGTFVQATGGNFTVTNSIPTTQPTPPTVSLNSNSNMGLVAGTQQIGTFTISASSSGDIRVDAIPVAISINGTGSITSGSVTIRDASGNTLSLSPAALSGNGTFDFTSGGTRQGFTITKGTSATFTVWATVSGQLGTAGSSYITFGLGQQNSFLWDDVSTSQTKINGSGITNWPTGTQITSNGTISTTSSCPGYSNNYVVINSASVGSGSISFNLTNTNSTAQTVSISIGTGTVNPTSITVTAGTCASPKSITYTATSSTTVSFTSSGKIIASFPVTQTVYGGGGGGYVPPTVTCTGPTLSTLNYNAQTTTSNSKGDSLTDYCTSDFTSYNLMKGYCGSDGSVLNQPYLCPNGCSNGACNAAPVTPTYNYPTVTIPTNNAGMLTVGTQMLGQATVTASNQGSVKVEQIVFNSTVTGGATVSNAFVADNQGNQIQGASCSTSGTATTCTFSHGYQIAQGTPQTFGFWGTVSGNLGMTGSSSVSTSLSPSGFIWDDLANSANGLTGQIIPGFPANSYTVNN